jgi:hypothetical protein
VDYPEITVEDPGGASFHRYARDRDFEEDRTDAARYALAPGRYVVTVEADGFDPQRREIPVDPAGTEVTITLETR